MRTPPAPKEAPLATGAVEDVATARRPGGGGAWSSVERQLPLLIGALLVPTIGVLVGWSYSEIRRSLVVAAETHIESVAREIGTMLADGAGQRVDDVRKLAALPAVRDCLLKPDDEFENSVRHSFEQVMRASSQAGVCELWAIDGERLLKVPNPRGPVMGSPAELHTYEAGPPIAVGIQDIGIVGATVFFEAVAEVFDEADASAAGAIATPELLGHVVIRRALSGNRQTMIQIGSLIGVGTTVLLGNRDGKGWNDLEVPVMPPAVDPLDPTQRFHRGADGTDRIGAGVEVSGTPWILWVESSARGAIAPARSAAVRMTVMGAALLVLGAGGVWLVSRRVTSPLRDATEAAEAIAAGRFDRRLTTRAPAEVGRLTDAFNSMTERVLQARHELEERVEARTIDLKEAVRQLREAQDSLVRKERLATLGQLAGGVGHELRNPLGVMTNAIYYLEMILEGAPDEVREYLGILRHQIHLSEKIISDLLDFARIRPPQATSLRLDDLVSEQLARLGPFTGVVEREIPAGLAPAWADPVQAGQVVLNLLTNAVQAMGESSGTLTLRGRADETCHVQLEVSDTGPGVPEDLREKIFEPLFTTRARGIGLGLAVSRRLAENNGGALRLEATSHGGGATFTLLLPVALAEES